MVYGDHPVFNLHDAKRFSMRGFRNGMAAGYTIGFMCGAIMVFLFLK